MPEYATRFYRDGETIYEEGAIGDRAFVVMSGKVRLSRHFGKDVFTVTELGPGEIFGEFAVIIDQPRTTTATMVETGELVIIPKERFAQQLEQVPPIIKTVCQTLVGRLTNATSQLHQDNDHSLFLPVCRVLELLREHLEGENAFAIPYDEVVQTAKDILQVRAHEIDAEIAVLEEWDMVLVHLDDHARRTLYFPQHKGFMTACERIAVQLRERKPEAPDETVDLVDLPHAYGLDPELLLRKALAGEVSLGLFQVSRLGLSRWMEHAPELAHDVRSLAADAGGGVVPLPSKWAARISRVTGSRAGE